MTKEQQRRERKYREQLKKCGFRSWKKANERRCKLLFTVFASSDAAEVSDREELRQLQILADLYIAWKTSDVMGRINSKLKTLERTLTEKVK